ncbi:hypothetical protein D3C85_1832080 [compost metagenome]
MNPALWPDFERGDLIHVRADGKALRKATVDDFTEDRSVVWVRLEELNERKILLLEEIDRTNPTLHASAQLLAS